MDNICGGQNLSKNSISTYFWDRKCGNSRIKVVVSELHWGLRVLENPFLFSKNGSHWPQGLDAVTILCDSSQQLAIQSIYIHPSSSAAVVGMVRVVKERPELTVAK